MTLAFFWWCVTLNKNTLFDEMHSLIEITLLWWNVQFNWNSSFKIKFTIQQMPLLGWNRFIGNFFNRYLSLIGIILRWGFLIWELIFYCGLFPLILVVFVLFLFSLRFGQISPLVFFRWFTATSDRNAESCNRIPSNYCLP